MSHPFQRAKRANLDVLQKLWKSISEQKKLSEDEKKELLKNNFIKVTGCSFRKLKEYCEDIGLGILW